MIEGAGGVDVPQALFYSEEPCGKNAQGVLEHALDIFREET